MSVEKYLVLFKHFNGFNNIERSITAEHFLVLRGIAEGFGKTIYRIEEKK